MSTPHSDIGPELRRLAQVILDRLDPAVRAAATMATETLSGPGRCQQVWCRRMNPVAPIRWPPTAATKTSPSSSSPSLSPPPRSQRRLWIGHERARRVAPPPTWSVQ